MISIATLAFAMTMFETKRWLRAPKDLDGMLGE